MIFQYLVGLVSFCSLISPLIWYLFFRWQYVCSAHSFFFICCETLIMCVGFTNIYILLSGWIKFQSGQKKIDETTLRSSSETIWYHLIEWELLPPILIIIPVYKEDITVLDRTLCAVKKIDYPQHLMTVVVGDDGKRTDTCSFLGKKFPQFRYHTRQKIFGHAKAGNINDILFYSNIEGTDHYKGEFLLILDCDMAPKSDILSNLLPLFYDPTTFERNIRCSFVQSPQHFCNLFGTDFLGQHYQFFYQVVLNAYSGHGMVPCCGTNVLFDRNVLMRIGGMQFGSVTEDFNTSLKLHSLGFTSRYYNQCTAIGFSPISLYDFYIQRERWAIGGLQIVFSKNYWSQFARLPWIYKWIYTFSGASPLLSIILLFLISQPMINVFFHNYLLCGISESSYISHFLPYSIVYLVGLLFLEKDLSWPTFIVSMQESIFMIPFHILFLINFILRMIGYRELTFNITPKRVSNKNVIDKILPTLFLLFPYILYLSIVSYCIYYELNIHRLISINSFWILFISFQILNPFLFVMQSLFI